MAYTEAQWNKFQQNLPPGDRISYIEYLKTADPAAYNRLTGNALASLKADSSEPRTSTSVSAVEGAAQARAEEARLAAQARAEEPRLAAEDASSRVKVGDTGMTQAQLDALEGQKGAAAARAEAEAAQKAAVAAQANTAAVAAANEKLKKKQPLTVEEKKLLGLSADGKPVVTADKTNTANKSGNLPSGFIAGSFPKELEQFFGSGAGIIGYRIIDNEDGSQQLEVADAPGSTKTFGSKFVKDKTGKYVKFKSLDSSAGGSAVTDGDDGDGKVYTASDGKTFTDQQAFVDYEISLRESGTQAQFIADQKKAERKSAYDLLFSEFKQYGLEALVTPLKSLIEEGVSPSEFTLRLRETDAYKKRFAANAQRVAKGLRALSEAEYIGTEDQYQDVMRRYGMPESYYTKGEMGIQSGFERFLAGDVSAIELEDRIQTAQNRVVNSNPEVSKALKEFYPGISNGDILAYVLDPSNAIEQIKRKVTAAEIGGAAIQSGLQTGMTRAEELAAAGITKAQAQQGFQTVAEVAPRGGQLAEIYKQDPYTQTTAEQEVFGLAGSVDAAKQRKKLTSLETAAFSGSAGAGAIARDRAGVI
jgi:hypothetical protein